MISLPGGGNSYADSTGKIISIGDSIRFRGQDYILKGFGPIEREYGVATLIFEGEVHTTEVPHECNVDKI